MLFFLAALSKASAGILSLEVFLLVIALVFPAVDLCATLSMAAMVFSLDVISALEAVFGFITVGFLSTTAMASLG